jgi:N-acetylglucosaminyldiphosphoundecaprenol N-acetyl-beta-D-mannosaminyltransferase
VLFVVKESPLALMDQQYSIMGVPVDIHKDYPGWLLDRLAEGKGSHVVTLNTEMVMLAESSPELAALVKQAELVIPDGAGVVLYLLMYGIRIDRTPGIELAESLLQKAATASPPLSVFFYGGAPGITETAYQKWLQKLPGLKMAAAEHGFHSPAEESEILDRLAALQPQIIFVGLGVPRQEYWIQQYRHLCPQAIWIGVGGSFDVWAEHKSRAPRWLRDNHLEWVYRLYMEPWRWRRMMALPWFALRAVLGRLSRMFRYLPK